ncbi:N-acetylmuramoyl-L-alanine amidase family protein [Clostridium sulfidigenes]|uniref:N-acetylmuramoyl-L-alanine amidase family protein n=1 Tax=Clostridium sulfidigenes TaxID=318464 RepID=UPI00068A24F8|nr:N-acetylmuramoyl-L-alanine amidase [Clostridium sulfidigenes]
MGEKNVKSEYTYKVNIGKYKKNRKKRNFKVIGIILIVFVVIGIKQLNIFKSDAITLVGSKDTETQEVLKYPDRPIVCIDAGHGGYDVGTMTDSSIYEKDITIKVALEVGKILEENQINVVYTRTSDEVPWPSNESDDLLKRIDISNSKNADVFVSIHCNSFEDSSVKGVESWCRFPNSEGESLAKNIQNKLASVNYTTDRRIKYESDSEIKVIRLNNAVSTLVELGYLTNDSDTEFLLSTQGQAKCAKAIADGILEYIS